MKILGFGIVSVLLFVSCRIEKNSSSKAQRNNSNPEFCECVIILDSINKATERQNISPAEMDALMRRWEALDQQCKKFTTHNNDLAESRKNYEEKVRKCLEDNGVN